MRKRGNNIAKPQNKVVERPLLLNSFRTFCLAKMRSMLCSFTFNTPRSFLYFCCKPPYLICQLFWIVVSHDTILKNHYNRRGANVPLLKQSIIDSEWMKERMKDSKSYIICHQLTFVRRVVLRRVKVLVLGRVGSRVAPWSRHFVYKAVEWGLVVLIINLSIVIRTIPSICC